MKARLGAVLFGIGILLVVVAGGLAFYVAPAVTKLPYDLKLCKSAAEEGCLQPSVAEATNARFLQTKGGATPVVAIQTGTLQSTTEIDPRADLTASALTGDLKDSAVVWDAFGTVKWVETGDVISQYSAELALDRVTAAGQAWDKQFLQDAGPDAPSAVSYTGQTYKFPFHTEQKTYQYFDRDLRKALPIQFQGTEEIKGTEAYRFQQVIPETELAFAPERLNGLLSRFAPEATGGKVTYRNTRTIWVEPVSGTFLKVQEQQGKTLVPDVGEPTVLLDGNFTYTDKTITNSVESAGETRSQLLLIGRYVPIALAVLGALALIAGLVLAYSHTHRRSSRHRSADGTDTPTGAHDDVTDEVPTARRH